MNIIGKVMKKKWGNQIKLNLDHGGTQGIMLLALDGWDLSKYENRAGGPNHWNHPTTGLQVRFSINGPLKMTKAEWDQFVARVEEEYQNLRALEGDV